LLTKPGKDSNSLSESAVGGSAATKEEDVDREQRQQIADVICREWNYGNPPPRYLESSALRERLAGEGMHLSDGDLLGFLDELAEGELLKQREYIGNRRIEGINQLLCEEPLNE
jgi:hypothetical protein